MAEAKPTLGKSGEYWIDLEDGGYEIGCVRRNALTSRASYSISRSTP
jgi:hypothetical protein